MRRILGVLMLLAAAQTAGAADIASTGPGVPGFSLEDFFTGETFGRGYVDPLIGDRDDFDSFFEGHREGATFVLDERFVFANGERTGQVWRLIRVAPDRYVGTVSDGAGAVEVRLTEDGAVVEYDGRRPGGDSPVLHFRHVMARNPDGTVTNEVAVTKFGLPLARSRVLFAKDRALLRTPE